VIIFMRPVTVVERERWEVTALMSLEASAACHRLFSLE
jgi:hypothetical protein